MNHYKFGDLLTNFKCIRIDNTNYDKLKGLVKNVNLHLAFVLCNLIFSLSILLFLVSCRSSQLINSDWHITNDSTLALKPEIKVINDSLILFSLHSKRLKENESSYFPTSQDFLVEIYTEKNNLLWKSDKDMNYLQVITPIEPTQIGDLYTYSIEWDGIMDNGKKLPKGDYIVNLILPARPMQYPITTNFKW